MKLTFTKKEVRQLIAKAQRELRRDYHDLTRSGTISADAVADATRALETYNKEKDGAAAELYLPESIAALTQ